MSIVDLDKIDAIGKDKKEPALRLMISDHLGWEDENLHIEILQDKINAYLQYIEDKQYEIKYGDDFLKFYIDIHFKEQITDKCFEFLKVVAEQLYSEKIFINEYFE